MYMCIQREREREEYIYIYIYMYLYIYIWGGDPCGDSLDGVMISY